MAFWNRIRDPVEGTAEVLHTTVRRGDVRMTLRVSAPGVEPFTAERESDAPADRRPEPGMTLPVVFDRGRPDRLTVQWDRVATADAARLADLDASMPQSHVRVASQLVRKDGGRG